MSQFSLKHCVIALIISFFVASNGSATAQTYGGTLKMGVSQSGTRFNFDPLKAKSDSDKLIVLGLFYDTLFAMSGGNELVGELAESWEASENNTTWKFLLRKGVTFSDGSIFSAEDVLSTFQRIQNNPESQIYVFSLIDSISAIDNYTVKFELVEPVGSFPFYFDDARLAILSSDVSSNEGSSVIGTGPYQFESYDPGVRLVASKRDAAWNSQNTFFDRVELLPVNDIVAKQNLLTLGEVDVIDNVAHRNLLTLKSYDEFSPFAHRTNFMPEFVMATNVEPFDDKNVRMALKLALDRQKIVEEVFGGYAFLANDTPIDQRNLSSDFPFSISYDPVKSERLLNAAGFQSLKVDLYVSEQSPYSREIGKIFKESAAQANIEINLIDFKNSYWNEVWKKRPFYSTAWVNNSTPDRFLFRKYSATSRNKELGLNSSEIEAFNLNSSGESSLKFNLGKQLDRVSKLISTESGSIIPVVVSEIGARNNRVGSVSGIVATHGYLDNYRLPKRWAFDASYPSLGAKNGQLQCREDTCPCESQNWCRTGCCQ